MILFGLALAAPVVEDTPFDPLAACIDHAGPVQTLGPVASAPRQALVVGVPCHDDPSIPSLQFGTRDALDLGTQLSGRGYAVHPLTTHVDRAAFLDALDVVGDALPPNGELLVYFSGHGVLRETDRGLERFLVFSDTDLGQVEATGLSLTDLEARIQRIEASRRVVVQDSCYAAGDGSKGLGLPAGSKAVGLPRPVLGPPDTRMYASRFYELATEDLDLGGSVYTRSLIEALESGPDLDGDRCVGLLEAHLAAARTTVARREGYQHPEWTGTFANDACDGSATDAVVLERGAIHTVAPGWMRGRRIEAGSWTELERRRRWDVMAGVRGSARIWEPSAFTVGGEVGLTYRGPVVGLFGVRGAWALPTDRASVRLSGGEGFVRGGVLTRGRLGVGLVGEVGALLVDPEGVDTPVQVVPMVGQHARAQLALGPVYGFIEGGVGAFLERTSVRVRTTVVPALAGGLGARL